VSQSTVDIMNILATVVKPYLLSITAQREGPAYNTGPVNIAVGGGCIPNREEASRPASIIQCAEEGSCQKSPDAENE